MKNISIFALLLTVQVGLAQVRFQNTPKDAPFPERTFAQTIAADIPYQGYDETQSYFGRGEYEIFLDTYNGVLNKPIIILDGFDPGNSSGIGDIYASLSYDGLNFADILRAEGFDIVVLDNPVYSTGGKLIDGGGDYIQRNAMVLIALIQKLNQDKIGEEELVVIGTSMGGLVAQYALGYMENDGLNAQTRLFVSFDAPHRGANIPISLQYLINYIAEEVGDASAQEIVDQVLNSPAAKEMLVDHYSSHLLAGSTYQQDPDKLLPFGAVGFRDEFQGELDAFGFPQNVRNVVLANGNATGMTTGSPGTSIVDTNLSVDSTISLDVALNFGPEAGQTNNATDVTTRFLGIPVANYLAQNTSLPTSAGVDSAPGGTGSIADALGDGDGNPVLIDFINALQQELYSFVPTMSSLAINNPDWFALPNLGDSPFDAFSISDQNEPHVTMNAAKVQFALDEIRSGVVGISENQEEKGLLLIQNPVRNTIKISILKDGSLRGVTTAVFDVTGKKLMERKWDQPDHQIEWPHNLDRGIYLLNLDNGTSAQTIKMVVE